jgi:hypothetical protein
MKTIKTIIVGLVLYLFQVIGESILGLVITKIRRASDVNGEGVFLFAFVKTVYAIVPFLAGFVILTYLTKDKLRPTWILLILNLGLLTWTYFSGLIAKDPWSFIVGSLVTSFVLVIADNKINLKDTIGDWTKGASLQQKL